MDNQWYDFLPKSESITLYEELLSLFCLQEDEATSLTLLELPSTERNPSPQLQCLPRPSATPQPLVVWDVCTHITWRLMTRLDILCPKFRFPSKKMRPYRNSSPHVGDTGLTFPVWRLGLSQALSWEAWHVTRQESKPNMQGTKRESSLLTH